MATINSHHFTAIRTAVDGSHIVGLLGKVIEAHITNSEACEVASNVLWRLFLEPSTK